MFEYATKVNIFHTVSLLHDMVKNHKTDVPIK